MERNFIEHRISTMHNDLLIQINSLQIVILSWACLQTYYFCFESLLRFISPQKQCFDHSRRYSRENQLIHQRYLSKKKEKKLIWATDNQTHASACRNGYTWAHQRDIELLRVCCLQHGLQRSKGCPQPEIQEPAWASWRAAQLPGNSCCVTTSQHCKIALKICDTLWR